MGGGGSSFSMNSLNGMLDKKAAPESDSIRPWFEIETLSIVLPRRRIATTSQPSRTRPPRRTIASRAASHIMPGPRRGYSNSWMSVLIVRRGVRNIPSSAVFSDRPRMR